MKIILTQKEVERILLAYVKDTYDDDIENVTISSYSSDFATLETADTKSGEAPF